MFGRIHFWTFGLKKSIGLTSSLSILPIPFPRPLLVDPACNYHLDSCLGMLFWNLAQGSFLAHKIPSLSWAHTLPPLGTWRVTTGFPGHTLPLPGTWRVTTGFPGHYSTVWWGLHVSSLHLFLTDCRHELNNSVSCLPGNTIPSCLHEFHATSCILCAPLSHRLFSCVMEHGSA